MTTIAPLRVRQSYRHEAYLWHDRTDYLEGLVPFIRDGIDAGEAVMAVVTPEHRAWFTDELGDAAEQVCFVDMLELGRNPARIIPAWQAFLDRCCARGRPARGIGEPVWPGRSRDEVRECQLHEALLNLAVDPRLPFWLLCPYDAEHLQPEVLVEAGRSHPAIATATSYEGSGRYRGQEHARALFTTDLPRRVRPTAEVRVTGHTLFAGLEEVTWEAASSNLYSDQVLVLAEVVRGLAVDGVRRGAARVQVRLWDGPDALVCEVADPTVVDDFLIGRRAPATAEKDPVWTANQTFDLVQLRSGLRGTRVRVHVRKKPCAAATLSGPVPAV